MMDSASEIGMVNSNPPQEIVPSVEIAFGTSESNRSDHSSPMTQSVDDFTMVSSGRSIASSITKSLYCQVVFHDVCDIYTTDSDIKCRYTLTSGVTAQPGDKVALFKIGWSSVSEYCTFVPAPRPSDDETTLTVTLKSEHLPKDEMDLYQVCYVTSGNVIAGASTPFSFHVPTETELIAVEDPSDPGMIVFKSRVSKLEDDLRKKNGDCDQLLLKQKVLEGNMILLKNELDKADGELKICRDKIAELFTEKQNLEIDNKILDERVLQYKLEADAFEKLQREFESMKASKIAIEAEYEELKIKYDNTTRLLEEGRQQFRTSNCRNLDLASSINQHYEELQRKNQQIESQLSTIQCLQQDCERTTRALKEQVKIVESVSSQNEKLDESMRKMAAKNNSIVMENMILSEDCNKLKRQNKSLNDEKLTLEALVQEAYENANPTVVQEHNDLLRERMTELEKQNSEFSSEIDRLKRELRNPSVNGDSSGNILDTMINYVSRISLNNGSQEFATAGSSSDQATSDDVESSTEPLIQKKLQLLRQKKAELSEELVGFRHRNVELENQLVELRQDNSCKKNRVDVLEIELRSANMELDKLKKAINDKPKGSDSSQLDVLASSLPVIKKFNDQVTLLDQLQSNLIEKSKENTDLKKKVENLLEMDAKKCCQFEEMTQRCDALREELEILKRTPHVELFDQLSAALDNCESSRKKTEAKLREETGGRLKAEQQVAALRAESVGKISVDSSRQMQDTISSLKIQLDNMTKFCDYLKQFVHLTYDGNRSKSIKCPLCTMELPPGFDRPFAAHFKDSHMN